MSEELSEETFEETAKRLGYNPEGNVKAEAKEEPKEEVKPPKSPIERFMERFKDHPRCPTLAMIDRWKQQHIGVYVFNAETDGETYLWRPLNRAEWKQMKPSAEKIDEDAFNEVVVARCVLWPEMNSERIATSRAGLCSTLFSVIMAGSYFMREDAALSFVEKL